MPAVIGQMDKTIATQKRAKTTVGDIQGHRPPPDIRAEKVRRLRQQLAEGEYDIEGRLNVVFDKLWKALLKCGNVVPDRSYSAHD